MNSTTDLLNVLNSLLLLCIDGNIINIERDQQSAVVKRAYRGLSKKLHPDKGGSNESFIKLITAKETLLSLIDKNSLTSDELTIDTIVESYINIRGIKDGKLLVEIPKIIRSKEKLQTKNTYVDILTEGSLINTHVNCEYILYSYTYSVMMVDLPLEIVINGRLNMLPGDTVKVIDNHVNIEHIQEVTQNDIHGDYISTDFGVDIPKFGDIEVGSTFDLEINENLKIEFIFNPVIVV